VHDVRNALIKVYQVMAIIEAITWTGLVISMVFKYLINGDQLGVRLFGGFHGFAAIGYVMAVFLVRPEVDWDNRTTFWALAAAVPPLATLWFVRRAVPRALALPATNS
jgi:integral membrane protein